MSAVLNVSGTVDEIIEVGRLLEAGLEARRHGAMTPEFWGHIDNGRIVGAIRVLQDKTGCSVMDGKRIIDAHPEATRRLEAGKKTVERAFSETLKRVKPPESA